jgi:hypothetical protein
MVEFDINPNELVVVSLHPAQFFGDVLPVVVRHLDVATPYDDVHATS